MALTASVCIPTRNRGGNVVRTLRSVLANDDALECIVVDQSDGDATRLSLDELMLDPRVRYYHYHETGISRGRNRGLEHATGDIVAFTDDDCVVPNDWLRHLVQVFEVQPDVGMVFGAVATPPVTAVLGANPTFSARAAEVLTDPIRLLERVGIGANSAVKVSVLRSIGKFDELMGAGAPARASEEFDLAFRMAMDGIHVYVSPDIPVVHYGFRSGDELTRMKRNTLYSGGWFYRKHLWRSHPKLKWRLLTQMLMRCLALTREGVDEYRRDGRLVSLGRAYHVLRGFAASLCYCVGYGRGQPT